MEKLNLIVNIGSASKKYAFYEDSVERAFYHFEHEQGRIIGTVRAVAGEQERVLSESEYRDAVSYVLSDAVSSGFMPSTDSIAFVAVRVVAPGTYFTTHRRIDEEYLERLLTAKTIAPLHVTPVLEELHHILRALPQTPLFGISDSAFHGRMSGSARIYGLPTADTKRMDLYRFGYHGISTHSVVTALQHRWSALPKRLIICHLGGGGSITALQDGVSVDTSMGFTPTEGLPSGTRVGTIDAQAIVTLMRDRKDNDALQEYLNRECGLLGVSGISGEVRDLLSADKEGNLDARRALDFYVYHVQKQIGAMSATLQGLDALVFTGTIGERSDVIRARVCAGLSWLGVILDPEKNERAKSGDADINANNGTVTVSVVLSREMELMSELVLSLSLPQA